MRCNHCHKPLTEDSRFCRFCGTAVPDTPKTTYIVTDTAHCRVCGKPIDEDTKRCTGCGKQTFRGIRPMTFLCIVLTLALLTMTVLAFVLAYRFKSITADHTPSSSTRYNTSLSIDSTSLNATNVSSFI